MLQDRRDRDPDVPRISRTDMARMGPAEVMAQVDLVSAGEPPRGRAKRGMLRCLERSLARRVVDEETGEVHEAQDRMADVLVDAAVSDPAIALRLTEATLRAQAEAAQDPEDDGPGEVVDTTVTLRLGEPVLPDGPA